MMDFLTAIYQKDFIGMCLLCMTSRSHETVWPQEDLAQDDRVAQEKTVAFGVWLWSIVLRLQQKFELQLAP